MKSFKTRTWQKPFLLLAVLIGLVPIAFQAIELEGGALYIEAADTTLSFEAPDDGMIFVGYVVKGESMGRGFNFILDKDTLMYASWPDGGEGANSAEHTLAVAISKGNHKLSIQKPLGSPAVITASRIWVLFWPKKVVAVAEDPGMPPIMLLASLCRAGTPISLPQAKTAIYDATGKLVERPVASWTPTEAGTYFVKAEKQIQKVTVIK